MEKSIELMLGWVLAAGGLGFVISATFARWLKFSRRVFLIPYVLLTSLFLYGFIVWSGTDVIGLLVQNWYGGVLLGGLLSVYLVRTVRSQPASRQSSGSGLAMDLAWFDYSKRAILDPLKSPGFVMIATIVGIALLIIVSWLFALFVDSLRPNALTGMRLRDLFNSTTTGSSLVIPPALFRNFSLALIAVLILHELVHGLFYWLFSGHSPKFGFHGLIPYASAPSGVYFPRNQFLAVGVSPIVLLTVVGMLLILIVPVDLVSLVFFNAAGAAGDLILVIYLLPFPFHTLMEDNDSGVIIYGRNGNRGETEHKTVRKSDAGQERKRN